MLKIIYAPNPIFKNKAKAIAVVDDEIRELSSDMLKTMHAENAVGLGANMVGIDRQIIVVDLKEEGISKPYVMINPEIIESSENIVEFEEASISFPGISAVIKRPDQIKVSYLALDNRPQVINAEGFFARVIQHEIDYLHGIVFIDYLSKLKRDMLLKKMTKFIKNHPPHVHGPGCSH
jgi:peptide deformylase